MKTIKILYFFIAATLFNSTIYSQDNSPRMMSLPEGGSNPVRNNIRNNN